MSAKCFVDSNIWLYAFMDSNLEKRIVALQLIESADAVLSTQVINEVCCRIRNPSRTGNSPRPYRFLEPIVSQTFGTGLQTPSRERAGLLVALVRQLAINKIHNESTKNRTQMTLIVMIDADISWIIRGYHNYLRHLRSIVFVAYFLRVT